VLDRGYRNVLIEINNECNISYDHEILKPLRVHELIERVKTTPAAAAGCSPARATAAAPFQGRTSRDRPISSCCTAMVSHRRIASPDGPGLERMVGGAPKPIVFNEDDHYDFARPRTTSSRRLPCTLVGYFDYG